jgi:hypothetical protein
VSFPGADQSPDSAETRRPAAEDRATADMLSVDARKVILLGTALFFAAFLGLLPFWSWLGDHGHRVWLWTALSGSVLGIVSLPLIRKHTGEGRLG